MRRDGGRASPRRHICPRPRRPRADRVAQRGRHASRSGRRRRRRGRRRRRFARVSPIVHSALRLDDVARESTRRAPERIRGESIQHGLVDASRFAPASRRAPFPVARRSSPPFSAFRARRLLRSARSTPLPPPDPRRRFAQARRGLERARLPRVAPSRERPTPEFRRQRQRAPRAREQAGAVGCASREIGRRRGRAALLERDARQRDLERRLARHEGDQVMKEAANLNDVMTNAMRDVRGFFSRAGNDANERGRDGARSSSQDVRAETTVAFDVVSIHVRRGSIPRPERFRDHTQIQDARGVRGRRRTGALDQGGRLRRRAASVAARVRGTGGDAREARGVVGVHAASRRDDQSVVDRRRRQTRRRDGETKTRGIRTRIGSILRPRRRRRRRTTPETLVDARARYRPRRARRGGVGGVGGRSDPRVPIRKKTRRERRFPSIPTPGAATAAAALPALAALAHARSLASGRERPGRVARDMLALGAANAATEAMAAYPRDATVAFARAGVARRRAGAADATSDPSASLDHSAASSIVDALREHRSDGDACAWAAEATAAFAEAGGANAAPRASRRARRRRSRTPRGGTRRTRTSSVPSRVPSFDWRWRTRPSRTRWKGPARRK